MTRCEIFDLRNVWSRLHGQESNTRTLCSLPVGQWHDHDTRAVSWPGDEQPVTRHGFDMKTRGNMSGIVRCVGFIDDYGMKER